MRNNYKIISILVFAVIFPGVMIAQNENTDENYTAYDLMSEYYNDGFNPFKKKNIYIGLSFSLQDLQQENTTGFFQNVVDGQSLDYNLELKSGYYISDYTMVGFNFSYEHDKFEGTVFRDPDTLQSNSMSRSFDFTPNIRPSFPLTKNERLSFFVETGLTFGYTSALTRNVKKDDEVNTQYTEGFHFRAGISPGITFFAMESFAFQVQLNLIGYDLAVLQQSTNNGPESRRVDQKVDAKIDLLSLNLGLSYYFGSKK
ncbi:MAG: DUF481 domain-containing protein [Bacteroidales bacterium]|nr:DUF481 domain-containing protein [Bacteroidales bacterium]